MLKIETFENGEKQQHWRPKYVFQYIQDRYLEPSFLVDISPIYEKKLAAIRAYKTQFYNPGIEGPETYISKPGFWITSPTEIKHTVRESALNMQKALFQKKKLGFSNLDNLIKQNT